jgi:plastocyanin
VALLGGACSKSDDEKASATTTTEAAVPAGPQRYTVVVDGPSTLGRENLVFGAFYPKMLTAHAGDTVVFDNRSSNDVHTVTLGVKGDRSDQPVPVLKTGQPNPAVFGPCFTAAAVRPDLQTCPKGNNPGGPAPPEFAGTGYWNSGLILFATAAPEAGPKTATVKLAADVAPGPYAVTCLLHPFMTSTLQVVAEGESRLSAADVAKAADSELGEAKAQATGLTAPTQTPVANGAAVIAGWGDKLVAVNRFTPETVTITAGQTVTWRGVSSWMPHTVSFQAPFRSVAEPNALLPAGAKSGTRYTGGVSHSGAFGPPPEFPSDTFSLTFAKAGTYSYGCLLHPGMAGTVQVS